MTSEPLQCVQFEWDPLTWDISAPDISQNRRVVKCIQGETSVCSSLGFDSSTRAIGTVRVVTAFQDGCDIGVCTRKGRKMDRVWKFMSDGWLFFSDRGIRRPYGPPWKNGDVISVHLDGNGDIVFSVNGKSYGGCGFPGVQFRPVENFFLRAHLSNPLSLHSQTSPFAAGRVAELEIQWN